MKTIFLKWNNFLETLKNIKKIRTLDFEKKIEVNKQKVKCNLQAMNDLQQGNIEEWNEYINNNPNVIVNLEGADFERAYLREAILISVNLKGANLLEAHLDGANLQEVNFAGASLIGADLQGAFIHYADLTGANLTEADLARAELAHANLTGANLTDVDLSGTYSEGANLTRADLTNAYLDGANLTGANLTGANLTGADLTGADLTGADLTGANLTEADLTGADLTDVKLTDVKLTEANLTGANLTGANLTGADLTGANLTRADIIGATLTKAILMNTDFTNTNLQHSILTHISFNKVEYLEDSQFCGVDLSYSSYEKKDFKFNGITKVEEISKNAKPIFVSLVIACLYSWLTIGTNDNKSLLTDSFTSELPIIGTSLPIIYFLMFAPIVLCGLYIYFHLYLQYLWREISCLPAINSNCRFLDEITYPWLLNKLVKNYLPLLKTKKFPMHSTQIFIAFLLAWWLVPITIVAFWIRSLIFPNLSLLIVLSIVSGISIFFCLTFLEEIRNIFNSKKYKTIDWLIPRTYLNDKQTLVPILSNLVLSIIVFSLLLEFSICIFLLH